MTRGRFLRRADQNRLAITSSSPINGFIYTYIERVKVFLVSKLQKLLEQYLFLVGELRFEFMFLLFMSELSGHFKSCE